MTTMMLVKLKAKADMIIFLYHAQTGLSKLVLDEYGDVLKNKDRLVKSDIVRSRAYRECIRLKEDSFYGLKHSSKRNLRYLKGTINMGLWYPWTPAIELKSFLKMDGLGKDVRTNGD
ncbi:hypothetical protein Tco_0392439 [Tanacetum coccineum]